MICVEYVCRRATDATLVAKNINLGGLRIGGELWTLSWSPLPAMFMPSLHAIKVSKRTMALAIATLLASVPITAHPTWLMGNVSDRLKLQLQLTTSIDFPHLGSSNKASSIQRATLFGKNFATPLMAKEQTSKAIALTGMAAAESAVWAIVELKPSQITLSAAEVKAYAEELQRPELVKQFAKDRQWRERYTKIAKAWLQLTDEDGEQPSRTAAELFKPANLAFELVPRANPASVAIGAPLTICAFANGQAVSDVWVHLQTAQHQSSVKPVDAKGCVRFDKPAGAFLLHSTRLQRATQAEFEWQSVFTSLTVIGASKNADQANQLVIKQ